MLYFWFDFNKLYQQSVEEHSTSSLEFVEDSQVSGMSLVNFVGVAARHATYVSHTAGRYSAKRFRNAQCPIVERLTNSLMMHGRNNGKKIMAVRIFKHGMDIIHLLTDQNPIQFIVDVVINRSRPKILEVHLPEDPFLQIAAGLRIEINRDLTFLREIASGHDLKEFLDLELPGIFAVPGRIIMLLVHGKHARLAWILFQVILPNTRVLIELEFFVDENSQLKAIDFGLSDFVKPGADGKKGGAVRQGTPYPKGGKTPASGGKSNKSLKSTGSVSCDSCTKAFGTVWAFGTVHSQELQ
ncbi:hypothetical protein C5167_047821 [Papaver somniferum]|uniref:Small ribosomal subunit protein uS7 domain-containing protein n=1 Tax=Papaver somniferum TaxID=3469 RepID=A0A4Y7LLQ0_PAPSO|nr:hypothetical protein C5167_047821 [Papaver somniferum]